MGKNFDICLVTANIESFCLLTCVKRLICIFFVDLPDDDDPVTNLTARKSEDNSINMFGHKLISLCKELGRCLANASHSSLVPAAV